MPELDGLRGLAALAVFAHHVLFVSLVGSQHVAPLVAFAISLSRPGKYGVDLFFVLSGYLITSILLLDRGRPHFYWNFYWKRALRIFPLYVVTLVFIAIFIPRDRPYVILSTLFIANFAQPLHVLADGPFWTLAIEEQFYCIWPQFAKRWTTEGLRLTALLLAASCLLLRLVAAALGHHNFGFTFFHCDGLALGALLACNRLRKAQTSKPPSSGRKLTPLVSGVLLCFPPLFLSPANRLGMGAEALQITGVSLLGFVVVRYAVEHTGSRVLQWLRSRTLTFFGLISYCLYMSHLYLVKIWTKYVGLPPVTNSRAVFFYFFGLLAVTILVSILSRYVLELPAMRLRRYVLRRS